MLQIHLIWVDAKPRSWPRNLMERERQATIGVVLLTKALMTYDSNLREERDTYSRWYAYLVPFYNLFHRNARGTLPNQRNWIGREFLGKALYYIIIFQNVEVVFALVPYFKLNWRQTCLIRISREYRTHLLLVVIPGSLTIIYLNIFNLCNYTMQSRLIFNNYELSTIEIYKGRCDKQWYNLQFELVKSFYVLNNAYFITFGLLILILNF